MDFDFKGYFRELQRRHVVKAGLAYLVMSWLILQVLDVLLPVFGLGESSMKVALAFLSIGFPIWLVIAWVYDFTPEGLKKTEDVPFNPEVSAKKNLQLNRAIIGGLSIAVILLLVNQVRMSSTTEPQPAMASMMPDFKSSIAVLAFDDMSPDKDQEYLSDGISEEILNRLAKYKDLNVKSRTSSFAYKNRDATIEVIGDELGVAYVLEGSVRKAGNTFRITAQLIDASDGSHVWSDTFDRKIEDVLFVQDEIAGIIAERLNLTLFNEEVRLRKVDPEAYRLYLQALDMLKVVNDSTVVIGDSLLRNSLKIDPDYSPSWAHLSATTFHRGIYRNLLEREEAIEIGLDAAQKAITLDSTSVIAMNWLSNWQWHSRQGNASFKTLESLMAQNPNREEVLGYAKHAYIRMGMPDKALKYAYRVIQLSPTDREAYKYVYYQEMYQGNHEKAKVAMDKYLELLKKQTGMELNPVEMAWYHFVSGDLEKALVTLEGESNRYWRLYAGACLRYRAGQTKQADELVEEFEKLALDELQESTEDEAAEHYSFLAPLYAEKKDLDKAFDALDRAFNYYVIWTEELWQESGFKNLHNDPRWQEYLDRLGEEFNFDYNTEG